MWGKKPTLRENAYFRQIIADIFLKLISIDRLFNVIIIVKIRVSLLSFHDGENSNEKKYMKGEYENIIFYMIT